MVMKNYYSLSEAAQLLGKSKETYEDGIEIEN